MILQFPDRPPLVSVVIPLYNKAPYIRECLASVFAQTYKNFEVIVANDSSTDGSEKIAAKYPIKLLNISNRGVSAARNAAILNSIGEFILPLDADDWIDPQYLSKTLPLMQPEIGTVSTDMQRFGVNHQSYVPAVLCTAKQEYESNQIPACSLIRREAFLEVGGYNSTVDGYEDWNLWIDILKRGWKLAILNEPLFHYRVLGNAGNFQADQKREELVRRIRSLHPELCRP